MSLLEHLLSITLAYLSMKGGGVYWNIYWVSYLHNLACWGIWWLGVFYGTSMEYHTCLPQDVRWVGVSDGTSTDLLSITPAYYLSLGGGVGGGVLGIDGTSTEYHTCISQILSTAGPAHCTYYVIA